MRVAGICAVDAAVKNDGLDLLFDLSRRFEAPRQRFGCQGGTGLQASVSLDGVFAVLLSANAILLNSAWL